MLRIYIRKIRIQATTSLENKRLRRNTTIPYCS